MADNQLKMEFGNGAQQACEGVKLSRDESKYLLPHFSMIIAGKPGSGKTTMLKQLLTNSQMYKGKFDQVLLVSPSHQKMGLDKEVPSENRNTTFNLKWIFSKLEKFNDEQTEHLYGKVLHDNHDVLGKRNHSKKMAAYKKGDTSHAGLKGGRAMAFSGRNQSFSEQASQIMHSYKNPSTSLPVAQASSGAGKRKAQQDADEEQKFQQDSQAGKETQAIYKDLEKLPQDVRQASYKNILIVLDDVVASIKKAEFDPRLSQLILNRRHLIINGCVSVIIVTQKYSIIPARVRSNCSWLILYKLNPVDFERVYTDAITEPQEVWRELLSHVFGIKIKDKTVTRRQVHDYEEDAEDAHSHDSIEYNNAADDDDEEKYHLKMKDKKYDNLDIWIESNVYFSNFKRIKL